MNKKIVPLVFLIVILGCSGEVTKMQNKRDQNQAGLAGEGTNNNQARQSTQELELDHPVLKILAQLKQESEIDFGPLNPVGTTMDMGFGRQDYSEITAQEQSGKEIKEEVNGFFKEKGFSLVFDKNNITKFKRDGVNCLVTLGKVQNQKASLSVYCSVLSE